MRRRVPQRIGKRLHHGPQCRMERLTRIRVVRRIGEVALLVWIGAQIEKLRLCALDARFHVTVASDEVSAPKPRPDVYEEALRRLGVSARRTVVIEDSPVGIAAGRGAGCTVVAVDRGVFDPGSLSAAHRVVTSLA